MDMRIDAMDCAAKVIAQLGDWAVAEGKGTVATVGFASVLPNAMNIIAQEVEFSVDVRSQDQACICRIVEQLRSEAIFAPQFPKKPP